MQLKPIAVLVVIFVVLLTACSKKGPSYTRYIPKDASYVVALDAKEMISKLEKDSLSVENMLEVLKDTANPSQYSTALNIWNQFKEAGLDFDKKIFIAVPELDRGQLEVEVVAGLKDAKKLEEFIGKMPKAPAIKKDKEFSYTTWEEVVIGWNSDAVIMLAQQKQGLGSDYDFGEGDEPTAVAPPVPGSQAGVEKIRKYFSLKNEESIASVDKFTDLVSKKADVAIFSNSMGLAAKANPGLAMMPKVKDLLNDIYSASTINFEDGKVVMEGDTYVGDKLADIIKKYSGSKVDMNMVEPFPSNNVSGLAIISFKPELILALLKEAGFDSLADVALGQEGLTSAEIVKAFKGDIAVIFSDFTLQQVEKTNWEDEKYMATEPSAKFAVAVRIGDKAVFDKLLNIVAKKGMITRSGNRILLANEGIPMEKQEMIVGIENDLFIITNRNDVYSSYAAKSSKIGLDGDVKSHINGSSYAMFVDAEKVMQSIPESAFDSASQHERNIFLRAKPLFKSLMFTCDNFTGNKLHAEGEVVMAKGKNSLSQLVSFLMYAAEEMKQKQNEWRAQWSQQEDISLSE